MADDRFIKLIQDGVYRWNFWKKAPSKEGIKFDLSGADLSSMRDLSEVDFAGVDLTGANLRGVRLISADLSSAILCGADLTGANLRNADLTGSDLTGANLSESYLLKSNLYGVDLTRATLTNADLFDATLTDAILCFANLSSANLKDAELRRADLSSATLSNAVLYNADLREAIFANAILEGSDLRATQSLGTDFTAARLTGACIKDWNTNADTCLQRVVCKYIFGGYDLIEQKFTDRIPHDLSKTFDPEDFTKLVQKSFNIVNLIFREGLDWRPFAYSFQQLQVQYADKQIAIRSIESTGDGTVVVKLATAPDIDKDSFEQVFQRVFEMGKQVLAEGGERVEEQHKLRLEDKDKVINQLFNLIPQISQSGGGPALNQALEKPPGDKSKWNRVKVILGFVGTGILALLAWLVVATGHLQSLSESWDIDIPGLVDSAEPDQSPAAPSPSSSASPSP